MRNSGVGSGIGSYMKFASLLGNSVSTGEKDLRRLLEEEMEAAFRQRKDLALRKAKKRPQNFDPDVSHAGVVMVMVVAPAFCHCKKCLEVSVCS